MRQTGKELYSPENDAHGDLNTGPPKVSSRTNSFEIENLLKVRTCAIYVMPYLNLPAELYMST